MALVLFAPGCQSPSGVTRDALETLCEDYWNAELAARPRFATQLGDRRFDDRLEDRSDPGRSARARELQGFLARTEALDVLSLDVEERVTRRLLAGEIRRQLLRLECDLEAWAVDPLYGAQVQFFDLPAVQTVTTPESGEAMITRWRAMGPWFGTHIQNLQRGLASGRVPTRTMVARVIEQIDDLAATPIDAWALLDPADGVPDEWDEGSREAFRAGLDAAVRHGLHPTLMNYRDFLRSTMWRCARDDEHVGIIHTEGGQEAYQKLIEVHTTLRLSPKEIHEVGQRELEVIHREMCRLGASVFGTAEFAEIRQRLCRDPQLRFETREQIVQQAREVLARAQEAAPRWFGRLPRARCVVAPMATHVEKHAPIAYYRQGSADGARPGEYSVNTWEPRTRTRYDAAALAFHEAVPGHHLQIALAQELDHLPAFRRFAGITAYREGWALYSERLADEMGLYASDLDRLGMLSFDAWRASRLVVDTGIHAFGWSRSQAVTFLRDNTALALEVIENEVDRYIAWPGQALAYKLGQLEILRLRALARSRLGDRFELGAFHDVLLGSGAVDLGTLAELVERWIASVASRGTG